MQFNSFNVESFAFRCNECGDKVCICSDSGKWAAHCMSCDNAIGHRGFYDPCADSEYDACLRWNKLNKEKQCVKYQRKYFVTRL